MFIKIKGKEPSYVNTDFIQSIINGQVQMADGSVYKLDAGGLEEAIQGDPMVMALEKIAENIKSINIQTKQNI
jgi:hypothetical protein|nr:MAG TPA: hypothetical protein [Caudoviricetes sp.]